MLLPGFGVLRNGESITAIPIRRTVKTGIAFDDVRMEYDLVPEYEERDAAKSQGIPWPSWLTMDRREQAACVAFHRISNIVSLHAQDAVASDSERRQRQAEAARKAK